MIDPALPLIDLHRHLEGCVRLETLLELGHQHNLPMPAWTVEGLRPFVQVSEPQPGVMAFISRFEWITKVMVDADACRRLAFENVQIASEEGIDYFELRFSPWFMAETHHLNPSAVVAAVVEGAQEGSSAFLLPVKLIGILSRTYGPELCQRELDALLTQRDAITALDLAGDEAHFPGALFVNHFRQARDAGWKVTVHAGESDGPASIRQAIHELGATRIGHAVQALQDSALLDEMGQKSIAIECNLTSNVQTSTVQNFHLHPLKAFLKHGLLATINSDDPTISAINLRHEYEVAAPAAGLDPSEIRQAQINALEAAFMTTEEREDLVRHVAGRSRLNPAS